MKVEGERRDTREPRQVWAVLSRGLVVMLVALGVALPSVTTGAVGRSVWAAIAAAGLLVAVNSLGYAELAAATPKSGASYELVNATTGGGAVSSLTGWALLLSGTGLCALLAQAAARYASTLVAAATRATAPQVVLASCAILLALLWRLLPHTRRPRPRGALVYVVAVVALVLLAVPHMKPTTVWPAPIDLQVGLPTVIVAFVGLELSAGFQRAGGRRGLTVARATLLGPIVAALLATSLALVAEGAHGAGGVDQTQAPLGDLGTVIAGPGGRLALLSLALLGSMHALVGAVSLVVRQLFLMGRDGFLPAWLGQVDYRRRAPLPAIGVAGGMVFAVMWLDGDLISPVAGLLYLGVLSSVNVALARRAAHAPGERREAEKTFSLPGHPWIPSLATAVNVLVLALWDWRAVVYALACVGVGAIVYVAYGRSRYCAVQEGITVFRTGEEEAKEEGYSVLVPIANPATASALLALAVEIARARGGEVIALRVEIVPEPIPLKRGRRKGRAGHALLDQAVALAAQSDWPLRTMTRVARTVADGILATAAEEDVDLIVTGWRGPVRTRETSLGPILDAVLRDASCDVLIMRGEAAAVPQRILVPSGGGPHARAAAQLALCLTEPGDGTVTVVSILTGPPTDERMEETRRQLAETVAGLSPPERIDHEVISASSVPEGIIQEASTYDLVLLGVSEEGLLDRLVYGNVPLQVAARVPAAGLVQGSRTATAVWTRRTMRTLSEAFPVLSQREQTELRQGLLGSARPATNYVVLIVLSSVIAALGLLLSSPAVVIGAMLIAPLMSPLMAFSLGLVLGDLRLIRVSSEAILKGIALALLIAAFIGLLSPLKAVTPEMLARSRPNLLDLGVALASGLAGAYALSREDVSAALPGVAMAASLMPPLATAGLGLTLVQPRVAGGALLLFVANIAAISLAGGLVFLLLGVRPATWERDSRRNLSRRFIASALMLIAVSVPLAIIFAGTVRDARVERTAEAVLESYLSDTGAEVAQLEAERTGTELHIVATVRADALMDSSWVIEAAEALRGALGRTVQLDVVVLPIVRSTSP